MSSAIFNDMSLTIAGQGKFCDRILTLQVLDHPWAAA
jgi:hypothetical protein